MAERLRRLQWLFERNPVYFVTANTHGRRNILATGAYVLMPDHMYAFVALDDRLISLSVWVKPRRMAVSKTLGDSAIPAPHWQKGFFDHVLRSAESYSQKWHYVRENPVRAGLISRWEDWPYLGEPHPLEYRKL
jgi:putative transposase